ncbi:methylenetetrahydrofolate reductase [NAD(P)H] [Candidatus Margulisiibacteriota bacterium]
MDLGFNVNISSNMRLSNIYNQDQLIYSFEVFPPKTKEGIDNLLSELQKLKKFDPAFISVTYGAGGSTQGRSLQVISRIALELNIPVMPHFTCIGSTEESILYFMKVIEELKIDNILALRGDPPDGKQFIETADNTFQYANELVAFLKKHTNMDIGVAGYPEIHPEALSLEKDLNNLKKKTDAGASVIITQLFFNNQHFFSFIEKAKEIGITIPIVPGIMPLTNLDRIDKIVQLSGAEIPQELRTQLEANKDNPENVKNIGISFAVNQIKELIEYGVPGIHFYTMNKSEIAERVLSQI